MSLSNVKKFKEDIHQNIPLSKSPNLSIFWGEYSECGSNKIGTSSTFSYFMCKLDKEIPKYGKNCQSFKITILNERKISTSHNIYHNKLQKNLYCKSLCNIYF
jgi:hypothetical protein